MMFRSQSRESRSVLPKVMLTAVTAEIHAERLGDASTARPRPETEIGRPEIDIASGEVASSSHVGIASSHSQPVVDESETGIEPLSGYPLPARQEPEIVSVSSYPTATSRSSSLVSLCSLSYTLFSLSQHTIVARARSTPTDLEQ